MKSFLVLLAILAVVSGTPVCDDSWKQCIGNTNPCVKLGCWAWPAFPRNTPQKEVIKEFANILVEKRYSDAAPYLDLEATVNVPAFGISLHGIDKFIGYLALGDEDVSDLYRIVNTTIVDAVQEGTTVYAKALQYLEVVTTGAIFSPDTVWEFEFTPIRQIDTWTIHIDSLAISSQLLPQLDLNPLTLCPDVQQSCTGTNQQFANVTECITAFSQIRLFDGPANLYFGNHLGCHSFHSLLAKSEPDTHCLHVGMSVISPLVTPCTDPDQYL